MKYCLKQLFYDCLKVSFTLQKLRFVAISCYNPLVEHFIFPGAMSAKLCSSQLRSPLKETHQRLSLKRLLGLVFGLLFVLFTVTVIGLYQQQRSQAVTQATSLVLDELLLISESYVTDIAQPTNDASDRFVNLIRLLRFGGETARGYVPALAAQYQEDLLQLEKNWTMSHKTLADRIGAGKTLLDKRQDTQSLLQVHQAFQLMLSYVYDRDQLEQRYDWWLHCLFVLNGLALLTAFFVLWRYVAQPTIVLAKRAQTLLQDKPIAATEPLPVLSEMSCLAQVLEQYSTRVPKFESQQYRHQEELRQLKRIYSQLSANPLLGIYISSKDQFTFVNSKLAHILKYRRSAMHSLTVADVFLEPRFPSLATVVPATERGNESSKRYETRALRGDGTHIDVEICEQNLMLDGVLSTVALVQDISGRVRNEVNSRLAAVVYDNTSEAIVVTDRYGFIVDANPALSQISGYSLSEVRGQPLSILGSNRQTDKFYKSLWSQVLETGRWQGDIWSKRKNGSEYAERLTISTAWNPDGTVYRFIGLFTDLTSHKEREVQMWKQAHHDHLTGLPNRQMFQDRLKNAMNRSRKKGLPFALIFMDLDFFKDVNDTLGHKEGDALLQEVALRLQGCVRETDTVARIGGDEFTVIVPDIHDEAVVDRICADMLRVIARPFVLGSNTATVSASLGVTLYPEDGNDAGELLKNADMAMYAAKACGRNQYCRFLPAMGEAVQARIRFSQDLQTAIQEHQFRLYYQPVVDLKTGRITKAEALIRWEHPQLGLVPPSEFIPFSEDSGLIVEIGRWVFERAALQAAYFREHIDPTFQVGINVSAAQLKLNTSCVDDWIDFMAQRQIPYDALMVEITERLLLDNQEQTMVQLRKLRQHNIGVALDDFGTGYSSLSYLKRFAISVLKIDQAYIRNLRTGSEDMALIQAMVVMAHTLGLEVVAEGVERLEQIALLQAIGCDMLQGFWCAPPMPANEFDAWCRDWNESKAYELAATESLQM